jgi:general stress protein 26
MTDKMTDAEVRDRLWSAIRDQHIGMLGVAGGREAFQPMAAFVEPEADRLWFFTRKDTDIAAQIGSGTDGAFVFQTQKLQAQLCGRLRLDRDPERIERYWSAPVAAWFPDGKDDPGLTLICMEVAEAAVWLTEVGPVRYALQVARANLGGSPPDAGERRTLDLH